MFGVRGGPPPGFSHRQHTLAVQLPCTDCHGGAVSGDAAGMPTLELCRGCHAEADEVDLPPGARFEEILGGAPARWASHASRFPADVRFSHSTHAGAGLACERCHGDVTALAADGAPRRIDKPECLACHEESRVEERCATCHLEIDENWAPPNHGAGWMTMHGRIARSANPQDFTEQCSFCHQQSSCVDCHMDEPPPNHTQFWRQRGHSIEARIDRDRCATCHQSDSCDRCHSETAPISHRGAWGAPLDMHCLSCHLNGTRECELCHDGTPSHLSATPMPPGHLPTFNCRQCHGLTAPLPHVDKGDECIACHF
jgi:hypothetical protein